MFLGVETGEDPHVGGQGRRVLHHRALEQNSPIRQSIEGRAGGLLVSVGPQMIGSQRIDRNQDHPSSRLQLGQASRFLELLLIGRAARHQKCKACGKNEPIEFSAKEFQHGRALIR